MSILLTDDQRNIMLKIINTFKKMKPEKNSILNLLKVLKNTTTTKKELIKRDKKIRGIIMSDQDLQAEIIHRSTNTLYYSSTPSSIEKAIQRIGEENLMEMLINYLDNKFYEGKTQFKRDLSLHSIRVAACVKYLCKEKKLEFIINSQVIFAALIHDIGRISLYEINRQNYLNNIVNELEKQDLGLQHKTICDLEAQQYYGFEHTNVGIICMNMWTSDENQFLKDIILYHGKPGKCDNKEYADYVYIFSICDMIERLYRRHPNWDANELINHLDKGSYDAIGITLEHIMYLKNNILNKEKNELIEIIIKGDSNGK